MIFQFVPVVNSLHLQIDMKIGMDNLRIIMDMYTDC